ncbi:hypothetical protein [Candidatus Tisiphia endosymbiont of Neophilaenus lineatus]
MMKHEPHGRNRIRLLAMYYTNCNNEHGVFIQSLYIIDFTKSTL